MSSYAGLNVVVFDSTTETYLSQQVAEVRFTYDDIDLSGLFPLDDGDRVERSLDEIEAWVYEDSIDASAGLVEKVTAWMRAIRQPTSLTWPGGYVPDDDWPFGTITRH